MGHRDQGKVSSSLDKTGIPSRYATLCLAMITGWAEKADKSQGGKVGGFVSGLGTVETDAMVCSGGEGHTPLRETLLVPETHERTARCFYPSYGHRVLE